MKTSATLPLPGFEPTGSDQSTSSAADSPAKTSARRARVPVLTVGDPASGESMRAYLASYDRASRSWKTSGLCGLEDLPEFLGTLPRSGWMRSGTLYLLPPLVRLTSAIASGSSQLLPTPTANDYGSTNNGRRPDGTTYRTAGTPSLSTMARRGLIPTPTASDANGAGSRNTPTSKAHAGVSLTDWAKGDGGTGRLIPTPTASLGDSTGRTPPSAATAAARYAQGKRNLDDWAALNAQDLLPTPQAQDHRNCADYSDGSRGHSPQLRHLGKGRLNPRFVEWMMGLPPGWTDVDGLDRTGSD
jgi:hypothetical protein